jgi:uncharacterized membrane protein YdjX (TVP38/TMEM64 family)
MPPDRSPITVEHYLPVAKAEPPHRSVARRFFSSGFFKASVVILLVALPALWWVNSLGGLQQFRDQYGRTAPMITTPIHMAVASLPIPADAICVANGALYGFWVGALLSWLGWYGAALVKFGLGRRARQDFNIEAGIKRLPLVLQRFPIGHPAFLIGSRLIPGLGGNVSTYLPGAAGVPLSRHLWCSAIAIIPGALLTAGVGAGLLSL